MTSVIGRKDSPACSGVQEQLEAFLPAADVTLPAEVLNRVDEIVAPGVTVNPADNSYGDFELRAGQRRR